MASIRGRWFKSKLTGATVGFMINHDPDGPVARPELELCAIRGISRDLAFTD